jgi:CheY-like chemotaxis protein
MTNEAILAVLNNLCNEARNSVHATFGLIELHRGATATDSSWQAGLEIGRASADRLLCSIDDVRDLLSNTPVLDAVEEFDLSLCLGETIELMSLASREQANRIVLQAPVEPLLVRQDRQAVEQVLTRILDAVLKLARTGQVSVTSSVGPGGSGVRFAIAPPNSDLAAQLADFLNADPELVVFKNGADVPFRVAVMVAGKRLRALGGTAEFMCVSGEPTCLAIDLPSQPDGTGRQSGRQHQHDLRRDPLNILLAEDSDDSYALSELLLRNENVWRAHTGLEAIDLVKMQRFDVVLMDVHMPGMDGYSAIRAIRDWETQTGNARTPIVVLSSDDLDTQRRSAAQSGCSGFLRKPLHNGDLPNLLARLKAARSLI